MKSTHSVENVRLGC